MILATRCTACGTIFRVVQDQLKVSEGWVRCGRCGDVFNALEGLFDLEREAAPAWTPSQRGPLDLLPATADERAAQTGANGTLAANDASGVRTGGEFGIDVDESEAESEAVDDTVIDTRVDSRIETRAPEPDEPDDGAVGRGEASELDDEGTGEPVGVTDSTEPAAAFMRQAERAAQWQRPRVRRALAGAAVLLALLLAGQAAVWQRDAIAARWPAATSPLALLCEPLGCRIEPLRRLDGLAVESSGLTQLDSPSLYRLQVAIRNRDTHPLQTPALDVTLTDNRGEVVARKVLSRPDFGAATPQTVAAGAELSLQAVLDSGERRISGYSIEIFYP
jgi:predicted Zn finger-like uncharacterized protein